jgi:hypothetical protein
MAAAGPAITAGPAATIIAATAIMAAAGIVVAMPSAMAAIMARPNTAAIMARLTMAAITAATAITRSYYRAPYYSGYYSSPGFVIRIGDGGRRYYSHRYYRGTADKQTHGEARIHSGLEPFTRPRPKYHFGLKA